MLQELFVTIHESASTKIWSKGVDLTRQGGIKGEASTAEEIRVRVAHSGRAVSPVVTLWPSEGDWNCDCGSDEDPCEHVVAAVIAVKRAKEQGQDLPAATQSVGLIGYRFKRESNGLSFARVVVQDGKEVPLSVSLTALATGRVRGPKVAPNREDMTIDLLLKEQREGVLPQKTTVAVIEALAGCQQVTLDGKALACSAERTGHIACIADQGGGVRLFSKQDPQITEVFRNGAALCGNTLRPFPAPKLSPDELKWLASGQLFGKKEIVTLVSEILPNLKQKIPVEIQSRNLPATTYSLPYILWDSQKLDENTLTVTPLIVYGDPPLARIENNRLVLSGTQAPLRNFDAEKKLTEQLSLEFHTGPEKRIELRGETAVNFLEKLEAKDHEISGEGVRHFRLMPPLQAQFNLAADGLDFQLEFSAPLKRGGKLTADPQTVLEQWREGSALVPLLDGGWSPLPKAWLERYGTTVLELLAARQEGGELPRCLRPSLGSLCEDMGLDLSESLAQLRNFGKNFQGLPEPELPKDLQAELRAYQHEGVRWLSYLRDERMGALLADDMGLGKTLQAICTLKGRTLVVCPTSVLYNWQQEIRRFRPKLKSHIYHGTERALPQDCDVVLTTYAILRLDLERLKRENWETAILDEAQTIKNPRSQAAQAAYQIPAKFRLALSGTPVENKLEDAWSLFHFLNPALLGALSDFGKNYSQAIYAGDSKAKERLRKRLQPFVLRRLKEDVAKELPPRTDVVLYCDLSEDEQRTYDAILLATRKDVLERLQQSGNVMQALEALLRLRQAACHKGLLPGEVSDSSAKLDLLISRLEETVAGSHKALVFSQWTSFLDHIEGALQKANVPFLRIDGSTKNRAEIVERFQKDGQIPVLLLSLKAAGVGLNLTAADHVYLLDPWWNPAVEDQAADRAHRIGQTKPVIVNRLVSRNTVEEKILLLQERKKELASAVVSDSALGAVLTKEDLLNLLA